MTFSVESDYSFSEATHRRLLADAVFFTRAAEDPAGSKEMSAHYPRAAVIFTVFYVESVSNAVLGRLRASGTGQTRPPRRKEPRRRDGDPRGAVSTFRKVWRELDAQEPLPDTDGLCDLYEIRNVLLAHPAGYSEAGVARGIRKRIDREMHYRRRKDWPLLLSDFAPRHAREALDEARSFLGAFRAAVERVAPGHPILLEISLEDLRVLNARD